MEEQCIAIHATYLHVGNRVRWGGIGRRRYHNLEKGLGRIDLFNNYETTRRRNTLMLRNFKINLL